MNALRAPAIECRSFSFAYASREVLKDVSFALPRGEWLSILGPNGSGKSTLLKNMLRLIEGGKMSGELLVHGRPLSDYSQRELARLLAYVPQAGGRIPPFTVADFVNLSRYPFGYRANIRQNQPPRESLAAMEMTNTLHLADRRLDALSGGQRQRVYLAAALAQDSDILLLDEPASFLDPRHAWEMGESLKKLHKDRFFTIITVTHDLSQPLDAGGQVLVLAEGRQIYFGPVENLVHGGILEKAFNYQFSWLTHPRTNKPLVVA